MSCCDKMWFHDCLFLVLCRSLSNSSLKFLSLSLCLLLSLNSNQSSDKSSLPQAHWNLTQKNFSQLTHIIIVYWPVLYHFESVISGLEKCLFYKLISRMHTLQFPLSRNLPARRITWESLVLLQKVLGNRGRRWKGGYEIY